MSWITSKSDNDPDLVGEGITRESGAGTELFPVRVEFIAGPPMTCTVRARTSRQALRFALARHPNADHSRTRVLGKREARALA